MLCNLRMLTLVAVLGLIGLGLIGCGGGSSSTSSSGPDKAGAPTTPEEVGREKELGKP